MFGIGGSEILVILVVALLFLGPDKLPDAAKHISKGIRDLRKQSRAIQQTIENDEHIGGAIRDLKSALCGEDPPVRYVPPVVPAGTDQLALGEEALEQACDDPHVVDYPGHAVTEPQYSGEPGDPAPGADEALAVTQPLVALKPPSGDTAPRNPPADDSDNPTRTHG